KGELTLEPLAHDGRLRHAHALRPQPEDEPADVHRVPAPPRHARAQDRRPRAYRRGEGGHAPRPPVPVDERPAEEGKHDVGYAVDGVEEVEARLVRRGRRRGARHVVLELLVERARDVVGVVRSGHGEAGQEEDRPAGAEGGLAARRPDAGWRAYFPVAAIVPGRKDPRRAVPADVVGGVLLPGEAHVLVLVAVVEPAPSDPVHLHVVYLPNVPTSSTLTLTSIDAISALLLSPGAFCARAMSDQSGASTVQQSQHVVASSRTG
ncbi:hypothetical protein THAOC_25853, partial [Thalassiosira oceanica]